MSVSTQPFAGTYVADPAHSSFVFTVRHMKVASFSARFDDVDARVVAEGWGVSMQGAARVESVSIKSPPEFREHVVYGEEFLEAGNHPEVTFRSDEVHLGGDGTVAVRGELTIRGVTRPSRPASSRATHSIIERNLVVGREPYMPSASRKSYERCRTRNDSDLLCR